MSARRFVQTAVKGPRYGLSVLTCWVAACGEGPSAPVPEELDETQTLVILAEERVTMAESAQLLSDGGMESGTTTPDLWWNGTSWPSDFVFEWADSVAATGSRSLAVREASGATGGFAYWGQGLDVSNPYGMTFELTVWIKLDGVDGSGVSIAIRGDDTSGGTTSVEGFATTQGREVIDGTRDWAPYTVKLEHLPSSVDRILVFLVYLDNNTGTAYFDDATLSATVRTPTLALQNTDVEVGGSSPEDWRFGGPGRANSTFSWSDSYASSGLRSLGITRPAAHPDEFGFWAQTIGAAAFAGGSATLTVWVRGVGLTGEGAAIAIRTDDTPHPQGYAEAFATTQGVQEIVGTTGWQSFQVTLNNIPGNSASLTVYLIHLTGTAGSVYFDEISLVPG